MNNKIISPSAPDEWKETFRKRFIAHIINDGCSFDKKMSHTWLKKLNEAKTKKELALNKDFASKKGLH